MKGVSNVPTDRHGSIDVFEGQDATKSDIDVYGTRLRAIEHAHDIESKYDICGVSLNSFLRNVFFLNGYKKLERSVKGSGVPGGLACWINIIEPMYACLLTIASVSEIINRVTYVLFVSRLVNISYGSLSFLFHWISGFSIFISDTDIVYLKNRILQLGVTYIKCFGKKSMDFEDDERCRRLLSKTQTLILHTAKQRFLAPFTVVTDPQLPIIKGQWTQGESEEKIVQLKEYIEKAPKMKLEIFGGDTLLDDFDESDEDDEKPTNHDQQIQHTPVSRILPSFALVQDPFTLSLLDGKIDALELARQWTIIDHTVFRNVALHAILSSSTSHTQLRFQSILSNDGSIHHGMCRRMIDRFNATALWIMHSILALNSPKERASVIELFIRIASHLLDLRNFNGVMVILSAMQQGCIARMKVSFGFLPQKSTEKLDELKELMAGNKNFSKYREELDNIMQQLDIFAADGDIEWRRSIVMKNIPDYNEDRPQDGFVHAGPTSSATTQFHDGVAAVVPYMGVHLAELTAISEGNENFLSDTPHLFNIEKYKLYCKTLLKIRDLQRLRYNFMPLRAIIASLNFAAKKYMKFSAADQSIDQKFLYSLSESVESEEFIMNFTEYKREEKEQGQDDIGESSSKLHKDGLRTESSVPATISDIAPVRDTPLTRKKSIVYDKIISMRHPPMKASVTQRVNGDDSESSCSANISSEDDDDSEDGASEDSDSSGSGSSDSSKPRKRGIKHMLKSLFY